MSDPLAEPQPSPLSQANAPNLPDAAGGTSDPPTGARSDAPSGPPARRGGHESADAFLDDDFFGHQPSSRSTLPDPEPLLVNLTRCVIEVLAGARELDQLARWVSDDVYRHLLKRVVLSARARAVKGQRAQRPAIMIGRVTINEPRDGIIEAVVIVHSKVRVRAVAVRLEGLDNRWRASAINVL
ncbi:Rv3235 family protein [Cryobacterium sp. PAMC25264]|uniref:Rv3235 family protein n=1 Tax=Cryobacterium sp. PAMC25264 TaxID=2861288 RepID=UPI001C62FE9B|nr:Rv3235 family protein [Cryobacterium sp. PAMC25264]QYF73885.1 hypothetical protein KY500_01020 [Cryobacterium sp. PAMC25264]